MACPTASDKSTLGVAPTSRVILSATAFLKPAASASTRYVPTIKLLATYTPAPFVLRVVVTLVSTFVTFTVAFGTMARLGSVIVPVMVP